MQLKGENAEILLPWKAEIEKAIDWYQKKTLHDKEAEECKIRANELVNKILLETGVDKIETLDMGSISVQEGRVNLIEKTLRENMLKEGIDAEVIERVISGAKKKGDPFARYFAKREKKDK
jgi:cobalamin biosynthesis protein CbiG